MSEREWTIEDLFRCPRCGVVPLVVVGDDGTGNVIRLKCRCFQRRSRFTADAANYALSGWVADRAESDGKKMWEIAGEHE